MNAAGRIQRIIVGVINQALADTGMKGVSVCGDGPDCELLNSWFADRTRATGLLLNSASKTVLLLAQAPVADAFPFGDLYHSEVVALAGGAELPGWIAELAQQCGGIEQLDQVLRSFFDDRMSWDAAAAHLPASARQALKEALDAARFYRMRAGLVPKIGGRTLGIDLYA